MTFRCSAALLCAVLLGIGCHGDEAKRALGSRCSSTAQCDGVLVCQYGFCRSQCDVDRECGELICVALPEEPDTRVCTLPGEDDCSTNGCPESLECAPDGQCRNSCDEMRLCGTDRQCISGFCYEDAGGDGDADADMDADASDGDVELDSEVEPDGDGFDGDVDADEPEADAEGDGGMDADEPTDGDTDIDSCVPTGEEQCCDGQDNDCDPATPDECDVDGDGVTCSQDCDDHASSCVDDCATDTDDDDVPDCLDLCLDADGDGAGVDQTSTIGSCTVDGQTPCTFGEQACERVDCDDDASSCTDDCETDLDADDVPDCLDLCLDLDTDDHGASQLEASVGTGAAPVGDCVGADGSPCAFGDALCAGEDCNDAATSCTTVCNTDEDGDGVFDCLDLCNDGDGDDHGVDRSDRVVGAGGVPVSGCTTDGDAPCAFADDACTSTDCDDTNDARFPGNAEVCDGYDNNCDSQLPADEVDGDDDQYLACEECDDNNDEVYPGADEICDGVADNNCDESLDPREDDGDGDGLTECDGDCNDESIISYPGSYEVCDGLDNDCDDVFDEHCQSCDITVPHDYELIQNAISVTAVTGDEIVCVWPGTYVENVSFQGNDIQVVGIGGPYVTTVDGNGVQPAVAFSTGETFDATLDGFTVTGGASRSGFGSGGVWIDTGSQATLRHLIIEDNHNAGVSLEQDSDAVLENVIVANNTGAGNDGGIFLHRDATLEMYNGQIIGNYARNTGGGLQALTYTTVTLENVIIAGNTAEGSGGGVNVGHFTDLTMTNCVVSNNHAGNSGGGVYGTTQGVVMTLRNVIFSGNTCTNEEGAGIRSIDAAYVQHCVFWDNYQDGGLSHYYFNTGDPLTQPGNIIIDPAFLNDDPLTPESWDYHLASTSLVRNLGDPAQGADPDDSANDMGAYGGPDADGFDIDRDHYYEWWLPGAFDADTSPGMDCDDQDPSVTPDSGC